MKLIAIICLITLGIMFPPLGIAAIGIGAWYLHAKNKEADERVAEIRANGDRIIQMMDEFDAK